jgi:hypothetical protein
MNKLPSSPAEILLQRVRSEVPPTSSRARVREGLELRILGGASVDPMLSEPPFSGALRTSSSAARVIGSTASRVRAVLRWASFGVAMTALGYWWGRHDAVQGSRAAAQQSRAAVGAAPLDAIPLDTTPPGVVVPSAPAQQAPAAVASASVAANAAATIAPATVASSVVPAKPRAAQRRAATEPRAPSAEAPLTLAQALELVRRAEAELRAGDASSARVALGELDRRAPARLLREERLVARALAACLDGDGSAAERYALELAAENPSSIYRGRLEGSCGISADKE